MLKLDQVGQLSRVTTSKHRELFIPWLTNSIYPLLHKFTMKSFVVVVDFFQNPAV